MEPKREPFYIIYDSFVDELHLSGLELQIYAMIFSFCTQGRGQFNGSAEYIARRTGASKSGVRKALRQLVGKGLLVKTPPHRNGKDAAIYRLTELITPQSSVNGGSVQSDSTAAQNEDNIKANKNSKDHLDMTRSELMEIIDPEERKTCVKDLAYVFTEEDLDNVDPQYTAIVDLICEMIAQPTATYKGETVHADSMWKMFVMNLRDDSYGLSICDFLQAVILRVDELNIKDTYNPDHYLRAVIWNMLKKCSLTKL